MAKDNFSGNSDQYARFRPDYPGELADFICGLVHDPKVAWDCGTGNGQMAQLLCSKFNKVIATDLSKDQLDNAFRAQNIDYLVQSAENPNFGNLKFDLITVAQAIHWFDFDRFYDAIKSFSHDHTILAVIGYGRVRINPEIDKVLDRFYANTIGPYWDKERRYIDEEYKTIPFPFEEMNTLAFSINLEWNIRHFEGYINTWSAVKHFRKDQGFNPVDELILEIMNFWKPLEMKQVRFPVLLKVAKIS